MERETRPEVYNPGAFKKGHEKLGGRKAGTHNATTKLLKECILMAAELEGRDGDGEDGLVGFLRRLANEDISAFAMLLGRVMPLQQIEARDDTRVEVVYRSLEEIQRDMEERGINLELIQQLMQEEKVE